MLKVTWKAALVGAPYAKPNQTNKSWFAQVDSLSIGNPAVVQSMPRAEDAFRPLDTGFDTALSGWIGGKKRVVVMVHGFNYDPTGTSAVTDNDPTLTVYGVPSAVGLGNSWLPLVGEYDASGTHQLADLAIGYSYCSDADFTDYGDAGWSNFYQLAVWDQATLAAKGLAFLLSTLVAKGIAVDILAHSLGTRTTAQAIAMLSPGIQDATIGKVVLLDGAEYTVDANQAYAGRHFQVFNIVNRKDSVLSIGGCQMCHPIRYNDSDAARVIGRDGLRVATTWVDIQLDNPAAQAWLAANGLPVTPDPAADDVHSLPWLRHWVCYTNAQNRALVSALVQNGEMTVAWFYGNGFPAGTNARTYGQFDPFIPATPPDAATRVASNTWSYADYETYNKLS